MAGKRSLEQKQQAMLAEMKSAQRTKEAKLTQNEAKWHVPNQPSV